MSQASLHLARPAVGTCGTALTVYPSGTGLFARRCRSQDCRSQDCRSQHDPHYKTLLFTRRCRSQDHAHHKTVGLELGEPKVLIEADGSGIGRVNTKVNASYPSCPQRIEQRLYKFTTSAFALQPRQEVDVQVSRKLFEHRYVGSRRVPYVSHENIVHE